MEILNVVATIHTGLEWIIWYIIHRFLHGILEQMYLNLILGGIGKHHYLFYQGVEVDFLVHFQ